MFVTTSLIGVCFLLATDAIQLHTSQANEDDLTRDRRLLVVHGGTWPKGIMPYVIEPEVMDHKPEYDRIMSFVEDHSCIRFIPWDNHTSEKFGLGHPGHIKLYKGNGCHSYTVGLSKSPKGARVSCCTNKACLHEIGHALGFFHEQQNPKRDGWIRVNPQNVEDAKQSIYSVTTNKNANSTFPYDISSIMHYEDWMMSKGGPTFTKLFPELVVAYQFFYFFMEIASGYRCYEKPQCQGKLLGCTNDGYQTIVHGKCGCICPPGMDAANLCKTPLKKVTGASWPKGQYALPMPKTGCPDKSIFTNGWVNYHGSGGNAVSDPYDLKGEIKGRATEMHFCSRMEQDDRFLSSEEGKFNWPNGNYCIYQKGSKCPAGFVSGSIHHKSTGFTTVSGEAPEGHYNDDVEMKLCCSWRGFYEDPMSFPADKPFALFKHPKDKQCQAVRGMRFTEETFMLTNSKVLTIDPLFYPWRKNYHKSIMPHVCYYTPVDMNCGGVITLSKAKRETTVEMTGSGRQDLRCTWLVKGDSKKGTLVLDFEEFNLKKNDKLCGDKVEVHHARIAMWGQDYKPFECNPDQKPLRSIRSVFEKMLVRFHTIGNSPSSFKAKVRWIPDEDMCYDVEKRGAHYDGHVNYTRTSLPCLPWAEMTQCPHHPFAEGDETDNLDGNMCRNPDNSFRPWCYTDKEGCAREYCDVCVLEKPIDRVDYCSKLKTEGFCTRNASQAVHFCAKTCQDDIPKGEPLKQFKYMTCNIPTAPKDATIEGAPKLAYRPGDTVQYKCRTISSVVTSTCLTSGQWSEVGSSCLPCPPDQVFYNGACFGISEGGKSFIYDDGLKSCKRGGGVMAVPKSQHEANLIMKAAGTHSNVWIDITDRSTEGTFRYKDGQKLVWKSWDRYEPNNKGTHGEDCAVMKPSRKWMDVPCTYRYPIVCTFPTKDQPTCLDVMGDKCSSLLTERPSLCIDYPSFAQLYCSRSCGICQDDKDKNVQCPVYNPSPNVLTLTLDESTISVGEYANYECERFKYKLEGHESRACLPDGTLSGKPLECGDCPVGFKLIKNACHGLLVGAEISTFSDAKLACKEMGGFIAMPKTYTENNLISKMAMGKEVRIGLTDEFTRGFVWEDGVHIGWSGWAADNPVTSSGSKHCTVMNTHRQWTNVPCETKHTGMPTVCTIPKSDDDLCYDSVDGGVSYNGNVNYTLTFQPCLPWNKVTKCPHHSFNVGDEVDNLEGNYCRNPDNSYRPWCYTDTDGCLRNYCDVCGTNLQEDRVGTRGCQALKAQGMCVNDPDRAMRDCLLTCQKELNIKTPVVKKFRDIRCGPPRPPSDGVVVGEVEGQYKVGDTVEFKCRVEPWSVYARCLSSGHWSETGFACLQTDCSGNSFQDKCYHLVDEKKHNYDEAASLCKARNSVIATPRSKKEADFIRNIVGGQTVMLGINDKEVEGTWVYQDGSKLTWTHWNGVEPNNIGEDGEQCACMDRYTGWLDIPCKYKYKVVCEAPRKKLSKCTDFLPTQCPRFLTQTPNMCRGHAGYARTFCAKTCGYC